MTLPTDVPGAFFFNSGLPVASRLECFTRLSKDDHAALAQVSRNVRFVEPRRDLISEGDMPRYVHLVLDGWACRYKILPDGNRQIVAYLIPGDLCDIHIFILREMDHGIRLLGDAKVAAIPKEVMLTLLRERPAVAGLAAPGMPTGSPGMEVPGAPADRYDVVAFGRDGAARVYASHGPR